MKVSYSSNNSGGSWWLKDKQWKALEDAGWEVEWGSSVYCRSKYNFGGTAKPAYEYPECEDECQGHRRARSYAEMKSLGEDARYLGALAKGASKDFPTLADAVREWEAVTGMDASSEGCNCCGAPHSFSTDDDYVSGDEIVDILYPTAPISRRAAAEERAKNQ